MFVGLRKKKKKTNRTFTLSFVAGVTKATDVLVLTSGVYRTGDFSFFNTYNHRFCISACFVEALTNQDAGVRKTKPNPASVMMYIEVPFPISYFLSVVLF